MIDPDVWYNVVFFIIAGIMIIGAIFTVEAKVVMHSVFGMATAFICMAMLFLLLGAEYLAIIQILVYVGAVAVLMAFAIMITRRRIIPISEQDEESERQSEMRLDDELLKVNKKAEGGNR